MYSLLSTVVAPSFKSQAIHVKELSVDEFLEKCQSVDKNFCGHPVTLAVLREHVPALPDPQPRGTFWDGSGQALAARPKGGVRLSAQEGDTQIGISDLEFCEFEVKIREV